MIHIFLLYIFVFFMFRCFLSVKPLFVEVESSCKSAFFSPSSFFWTWSFSRRALTMTLLYLEKERQKTAQFGVWGSLSNKKRGDLAHFARRFHTRRGRSGTSGALDGLILRGNTFRQRVLLYFLAATPDRCLTAARAPPYPGHVLRVHGASEPRFGAPGCGRSRDLDEAPRGSCSVDPGCTSSTLTTF